MSAHRFLLVTLSAFGLLVGAIQLYLARHRDVPPPSAVAIRRNPLDDPELQRLVEKNTPSNAPHVGRSTPPANLFRRRDGLHASRGESIALRRAAADVADRLDDASVRLRGEIGGSAAAQVLAAEAALRERRFDEASRLFDRALARSPKNVAAVSGKAAALAGLGRLAESRALYAQVVRDAPNDPAARYNFGVVLYRQAEFGDASEQFREVIRLDPAHAESHYNLATLAQRDGRLAEAREAWEAFTRLRPQVPSGWFNLGLTWMDYGEPQRAADCFQRFTAMQPADPAGFVNLGIAEGLSGRLDASLAAVVTADLLSPCDEVVMRCLADVHESLAARGDDDADRHRALAESLRRQIGADRRDVVIASGSPDD